MKVFFKSGGCRRRSQYFVESGIKSTKGEFFPFVDFFIRNKENEKK